jgi:hypothetical protein
MAKLDKLTDFIDSPLTRRSFAKGVSLAAVGVAGATMLGSTAVKAIAATTGRTLNPQIDDIDILNFALNLEYLEAEFYCVATTGKTLVELGILQESDTSGPTTGGNQVPGLVSSINAPVGFIANALRSNEIAHVLYLRSALGSAAVLKPTINLNALGYGFANTADFLKLSRQFEDVGVSAYAGAAPLISSKTYLEAAARILGTEAEHSGSIRDACITMGVVSPPVDDLDVPPTRATPFCVDNNALAIARTTAQVLNIVYAGGNCSGGFYPDGMNGTIVCQS